MVQVTVRVGMLQPHHVLPRHAIRRCHKYQTPCSSTMKFPRTLAGVTLPAMAALAPLGSDAAAPCASRDQQKTASSKYSSSYEVADAAFSSIIDHSQPVHVVAERDYAFAHEAPVYLDKLNKLFFVSNRLGDRDSAHQHIQLQTLDLACGAVEHLPQHLVKQLPMPNGATNWPATDDSFVLVTQGSCDHPPAINRVNLSSMSSEVLLDSYQGKQFNSPNDVVLYCDGSIWFTDPPYGYKQNFRPPPELGSRVYAFNPTTGAVSVLAEDFAMCNGIAFSPDFQTLYVTDTGEESENTQPRAETIYAFDVVAPAPGSDTESSDSSSKSSSAAMPRLENRRVFAVTCSIKPDGIKVDSNGNVYTGTHDGVEVFAPSGARLGSIKCGRVTNLAFIGSTLYCLSEEKIQAVKLNATGAQLP
ncbi:calcium-dependent phosphotriesterase [Scenedesmus sp. NREL 46B-D3]|nr:calcium-dependent phosphotriesterase [Scenedesmus sp. NREL 46B-D3]